MRRVLLALAVVTLLAACNNGGDEGGDGPSADAPGFSIGKPPWPLETPQAPHIRFAGLPTLSAEGDVVHFHAHLDVIADGEAVAVPANIGVDPGARVIAPLHTHGSAGILHVEANNDDDVTLGQFLLMWGLNNFRMDGPGQRVEPCVAAYCEPEGSVAVYVDGEKQSGSAVDLVIRADAQIALILGAAPAEIPAFYDCSRAGREASTCQNFPKPT